MYASFFLKKKKKTHECLHCAGVDYGLAHAGDENAKHALYTASPYAFAGNPSQIDFQV